MKNQDTELLVFDFAMALKFAGNNKTTLKDSLTIFMNNIGQELKDIKHAFEQEDIEVVSKIAHRINGSSGYLGAQKIQTTCKQITQFCELKKLGQINNLISNLEKQVTIFMDTIKTHRVLDVLR